MGIIDVKQGIEDHINSYRDKSVDCQTDKDDTLEESYTLNFFPNPNKLASIVEEISYFQNKYPENRFIDIENLHVTLLASIPLNISTENIKEFTQTNIRNNIVFKYEGINLTRKQLIFMSYPLNFDLNLFRDNFKKEISNSIKDYYKGFNYVGWSTFMWFYEQPDNSLIEDLIQRIHKVYCVTEGEIKLIRTNSRSLSTKEIVFTL